MCLMCTGGGGGAPSPEPWEKKAENRNITDLNGREIFIELSGSPNLSKYEPFSKLDVAQLILALSETVAPFLGSKLGALCYLYIANTGLYNRSCIFQYCPLDGKIDHFFFFTFINFSPWWWCGMSMCCGRYVEVRRQYERWKSQFSSSTVWVPGTRLRPR